MKKIDYIIVGMGIGGLCLSQQLRLQGKTFVTIDSGIPGATLKSGGVFNPTVLKRFTAAWHAFEFFPFAKAFYRQLAAELNNEFILDTPILRVFSSVEEQNNWSVASDKVNLREFLSSEQISNSNHSIIAPLGFGKVQGTARINVPLLFSSFRELLQNENAYREEEFNYKSIKLEGGNVYYKDLCAPHLIFSEGPQAVDNPFFPKEAILPNKGEYLLIHAPELHLEDMLKGPLYVIPIGNSNYKVGATYDRFHSDENPTEAAREEMESKLKKMINCPFEVIDHSAGIRPTTKDRKPLIGSYDTHPAISFFNGLGSRGFLMAPMLAKILVDHLEMQIPIPSEMDINRVNTA